MGKHRHKASHRAADESVYVYTHLCAHVSAHMRAYTYTCGCMGCMVKQMYIPGIPYIHMPLDKHRASQLVGTLPCAIDKRKPSRAEWTAQREKTYMFSEISRCKTPRGMSFNIPCSTDAVTRQRRATDRRVDALPARTSLQERQGTSQWSGGCGTSKTR